MAQTILTEEQIERFAERQMDKLDECLAEGDFEEHEYEAKVREIEAWTKVQYERKRNVPQHYAIVAYEADQCYGGAEEGGWWYECGNRERILSTRFVSLDDAHAICYRAQRWMDRLQRHRRPISSMAYDGGRYSIRVYPVGDVPKHYPVKRPHYE